MAKKAISKEQLSRDIERVKAINDTLKDKGYSWDEIEVFWQDCIKIAKEQKLNNN